VASPGCCQIEKKSICVDTVGLVTIGFIGSSTMLLESTGFLKRLFTAVGGYATEMAQKLLTWKELYICKNPRMKSSAASPL
jgi:hypothetical protein